MGYLMIPEKTFPINRPSYTASGAREVSSSKRGEVTNDFKVPSKA